MRLTVYATLLCCTALAAVSLGERASAASDDSKEGADVKLGDMQSRAPASWQQVDTRSPMRLYQFRIPKAEGDARAADLIIFHFAGGGGSAADNIKRWQGMFIPPEGRSIEDVSHVDHFKVGDAEVTYLDVHGTYKYKAQPFNPNSPEERRPDQRMIAVVIETKSSPYYMRFVGPAKTVAEHKKEFDEWLKSFK